MGSGVDLCHRIAGQSVQSKLGSLSACRALPPPPLAQNNHEVNGDQRKQNLLNQMPLGNGTPSYRFPLQLSKHDAVTATLMLPFVSSFQNNITASPRSALVSSLLSLFVKEDCGDGRKACSAQNGRSGNCSCLAGAQRLVIASSAA